MNEKLWKLVDESELEGATYWDAYNSLTRELEKADFASFLGTALLEVP